jgi:hypothetical protein
MLEQGSDERVFCESCQELAWDMGVFSDASESSE